MTPDELITAQYNHIAAQQHAEATREIRNAAIRAALEAGWTHAQVAGATGLTRGRIGQLTPPTRKETA